LRRPSIEIAVAINRAARREDEWFEDPDDLGRVRSALAAIEAVEDPVAAAAILAFRVARAQGFVEGNKRTALLLARWVLDHNGIDGSAVIPADDRTFADYLVKAASGIDVENEIVSLLTARR